MNTNIPNADMVEVKVPTGRLMARADGDEDYPGITVVYADDEGREEVVARVEFPVSEICFYGTDESYQVPETRIIEKEDENGRICKVMKPGLLARVYQRVWMTDDDPISVAFDMETGLPDAKIRRSEGVKIWVDDLRPSPSDCFHEWAWCKSVNTTKTMIEGLEAAGKPIAIIDIDHDAGVYSREGGDYIKILDWLEETGRNYPIRIHSQNAVGVANMRAIIEHNGWKEVR